MDQIKKHRELEVIQLEIEETIRESRHLWDDKYTFLRKIQTTICELCNKEKDTDCEICNWHNR